MDAAPSHGKLALKADGSFVYTPAKDYTGTDTFTYKIMSGAETDVRDGDDRGEVGRRWT